MTPSHQFRTDAHFCWRAVINKGQTNLCECDITITIYGPHAFSLTVPHAITQGGKAVEFNFLGIQQRYRGSYGLKMLFNYGKHGMGCIDIPNAFELDDTTNSLLVYQEQQHTLEYDSALSIGLQGPQGRPGYTPRKSVDYFTKKDIDAIVQLTHDSLHDELKAELHDELKQELYDELKTELYDELKEELHDILKEELYEELKKVLHDDLKEALHDELKEELNEDFFNDLKASVLVEIQKDITE